MTTTNGEQVIKHDEYTVGMRVRLADGIATDINKDDGHDEWPLGDCYGRNFNRIGERVTGFGADIIGEIVPAAEVVANEPTTQSATTAKRVDFTASEERVYDDGMRIKDGRVDSKTMAALLDDRRYADRAIDRLKAWGKHYGREV